MQKIYTWEPVEEIARLRRLLKKNHAENPDKPTATSPPGDKGAPPPPMAVLPPLCATTLQRENPHCATVDLRLTVDLRPTADLRVVVFSPTPAPHLCPNRTTTHLCRSAAADSAKNLHLGFDTLCNTYAQRVPCKS